jgi:hypothetical protein
MFTQSCRIHFMTEESPTTQPPIDAADEAAPDTAGPSTPDPTESSEPGAPELQGMPAEQPATPVTPEDKSVEDGIDRIEADFH